MVRKRKTLRDDIQKPSKRRLKKKSNLVQEPEINLKWEWFTKISEDVKNTEISYTKFIPDKDSIFEMMRTNYEELFPGFTITSNKMCIASNNNIRLGNCD